LVCAGEPLESVGELGEGARGLLWRWKASQIGAQPLCQRDPSPIAPSLIG
jgi:hypothetical protein